VGQDQAGWDRWVTPTGEIGRQSLAQGIVEIVLWIAFR
jgi:hypothetical protein